MPAPSKIILALRRQLAAEIVRSLGPRSQACIAPGYGIRQPRMSELERGIVERCSIEWLIRRVERMGGSVQVTVTLGDARRRWWVEGLRRGEPRESNQRSAPRQRAEIAPVRDPSRGAVVPVA